ncbi:MAG: grasp-with-spasm system ATP-grasp peptide maturase [Sphingobacteriales bacterium]|nr:grasp-with-spasm system ATP-grasp peptide maturase [Sphingobacteriales bacterium]
MSSSVSVHANILISSSCQNIVLKFNKLSIDIEQITSFWYRRDMLNIKSIDTSSMIKEVEDTADYKIRLQSYLQAYLQSEINIVIDFMYYLLKDKKHINSHINNRPNKLCILHLAQKAGLDTPLTLITEENECINNIFKDDFFISKAITECVFWLEDLSAFSGFTTKGRNIDISKGGMFISQFQEKLDKLYELRIFYLEGICHTVAIFSQLDEQTIDDFRHYNKSYPNRTPPYKLPKEIEKKITSFMQLADYNCGSIDMIVTKDKRYVFLEINPIGQFQQVSKPANFYLERSIANFLHNES